MGETVILVWRIFLILILWGDLSVKAVPLLSVTRRGAVAHRSASREFVVYGTQKDLVAYVMKRADSLAARWNRLFGFSAVTQKPIVIRFIEDFSSPSGRTPFETRLYLGDDHNLKVQLDVWDLSEVRESEFDREIFQALALRNGYTAVLPAAGSKYYQPPDWIMDALIQDVLDSEEGDFARSYAAALVVTQNLDLKDFLAEKTWTDVSRVIYRVKARALLQSLIEFPRGAAGMRAFLSNPAAWDGSETSLLAYFPELQRNTNSLTKVWMLNLARPTMVQRTLPLRMNETAQRLDAILSISPPNGVNALNQTPVGMAELPLLAATPKYKHLLRSKAQDLLLLSLRAHPMYRSLIDEYREILETLIRYPRKNLDARIVKAEKLRWALNQRSVDIEDYMNWFEAVLLKDALNPFQSILENDQRRRAPQWRSDAISRALDTVEATGGY